MLIIAVLNELLFECYGVPSVCYGVDALFSWTYNRTLSGSPTSNTSLVISAGNETTHVLPVIHGAFCAVNASRYAQM